MPYRRLTLLAAVASTLVLAGCSSSSTPAAVPHTTTPAEAHAGKVAAWYAGGGDTLTTKFGDDLTALSEDGKNADSASMQADCNTLIQDVGAAQNYPAIPDTEAQTHWSAALGHLSAAGGDCSRGTRAKDATLIGKASGELRKASSEMALTTARVNALMPPD